MVVFPKELSRKISLLIIIKEKLLYFNTIYPGELIIRLQEEKLQVKVLWCKNNQ